MLLESRVFGLSLGCALDSLNAASRKLRMLHMNIGTSLLLPWRSGVCVGGVSDHDEVIVENVVGPVVGPVQHCGGLDGTSLSWEIMTIYDNHECRGFVTLELPRQKRIVAALYFVV